MSNPTCFIKRVVILSELKMGVNQIMPEICGRRGHIISCCHLLSAMIWGDSAQKQEVFFLKSCSVPDRIQTGFSLPAFGDPCTGARARHRQRTVTPRIYILLYIHTLYICGVSIEIRLDGDSEKSVILAIYESRYFNVTIQELHRKQPVYIGRS